MVFMDKSGGCTVDIEKFRDFYQKLLNKHPKPIVKNILDVKEHPINIQNPILKILTCLLAKRLSLYAEEQCLLPDFQFGYRKDLLYLMQYLIR